MSTEDIFDPDLRESGFVRAAAWQAQQFERVAAIRQQIAALEAEEVRVLAGLLCEAEGEACDEAVEAGDPGEASRRRDLAVRSIATELAGSTCTSLTAAQARLAEAWVLCNELPATLSALEVGDVSRAHAHEMVVETDHLGGRRGEAEAALLPLARTVPPAQFRRRAKRVLETLEKGSLLVRHERALARRRVDLTPARDGMAHLDAYLDAADAALLKTGLTNAAAEARARGDSRTGAQLEADLLVQLLGEGNVTVGATCDCCPEAGAPAGSTANSGCAPTRGPLVSRAPVFVEVLIPAAILAGSDDHAAGIAEITGLGPIDPATARRLVARAPSLRRILTDPITSAITDFDRKSYRVPAELKRVIRRRDGHCRAPGCSQPVTELDHTRPYATGGTTTLENLACLCANHHHLKHEAGWGLKQYLDGTLEWTGPSGRCYTTHPEVDATSAPRQPLDPWHPPETHEPAPFDNPDGDEDESES